MTLWSDPGWRPVLATHGGYRLWVRQLRGAVGVYLIRDKATRQVLYIGESHRRDETWPHKTGRRAARYGRLYWVLIRHFQTWSHRNWRPDGARQFTCDAAKVEVKVFLTEPETAQDFQYALIRKHDPEFNIVDGHTIAGTWMERREREAEPVPF